MITSFFNKIFQALKNFFSGDGASDEALDPSELTRTLLEAAQEKAKRWDDKLDLPNAFDVYMSQYEWDSYFGARVNQTESRLEAALTRFAEESGACMEQPKVTIMIDDDLMGGEVSIEASFTVPCDSGNFDDMDPTPVYHSFERGQNASGDVAGWTTTPVFDTSRGRGPASLVNSSTTPQFRSETRAAFVTTPESDRRFDVHDGNTIGLLRDPSREMPTIQLPSSKSLVYCSQVQGEFRLDGDKWSIVDRGLNGMSVQRNREWLQAENKEFVLKDGDSIYCGSTDSPAFVFHCDSSAL